MSNPLNQFGLPMTDGNVFNQKKQFDAQEEINESFRVPEYTRAGTSFDSKVNDLKNINFISQVSIPTYQDWFLMLQEGQYYTNLYDVETEDVEIKKMWKMLTWTLYFYGNAAVQKLGDKYMVYCLSGEIIRDGTGYPIEAKGMSSSIAMSSQIKPDELKTISPAQLIPLNSKSENIVFFKYNQFEYSAWLTIYPYIKELQNLLTMSKVSSYMLSKKLKYVENNEEASTDELNCLFNPNLPYIKVKGVNPLSNNKALIGNTIEEIKVGSGNTKDITDYIDWFQNFWYSKIGRRTNVNEKQERNINSEVMTSQNNFDVLENELRDWLEIGIMQMKEKFGIDIELTFIQTTKEADDNMESEEGVKNDKNK